MTTTRRRLTSTPAARLRSLGVVGAASLLMLTGCSGWHPGVAADVNGTTISVSEVDQLADSFCTGYKPQLGSTGASGQVPGALSLSSLRVGVLQQLVAREVADEVGRDFDVTPGVTYKRAVQSARAAAAAVPEAVRDDFVDVQTTGDYISDIVTQAAQKDLVASGTANPTQQQISDHASEMFAAYLDKADIEIDPRFGMGSDLQAKDGSVSFAVSKVATGGEKSADDDEAYAQSLPASLRCEK
ncbi:MAG: hypothetical protein U0R80_16595 [Nocardioidaceae bacterium]